jgi:class 3 adenylate cyclase
MNRGAYDFLLKPVDFADLELTMDKTLAHVKQIRETLKAIKENNILKMYVDVAVLDYMNTPGFENSVTRNEHIDATVMFVDICGFTSIAETQPVKDVVEMLNRYFDVIVKEIIEQGGHVDKFMGDAVMAVFRGDNHLNRSVQTALGIRRTIDALGVSDEINYRPKVSIGLNTGDLISGNIGSASLKRLDYTVIGDVVNTAQRLQSAAKPGQIIINEHTCQLLKDRFNCEKLGEVPLKNKSLPAIIYNVIE